jgi:hypothetical protein
MNCLSCELNSRGYSADGMNGMHGTAMSYPENAMHALGLARDVAPTDLSLPPAWQGRSVAGPKLRLVEMLAYAERGCPYDPNSVRKAPID